MLDEVEEERQAEMERGDGLSEVTQTLSIPLVSFDKSRHHGSHVL